MKGKTSNCLTLITGNSNQTQIGNSLVKDWLVKNGFSFVAKLS